MICPGCGTALEMLNLMEERPALAAVAQNAAVMNAQECKGQSWCDNQKRGEKWEQLALLKINDIIK